VTTRTDEVRRFWREFCERHGEPVEQRYDVYAFGDSPAMADELAELVVNGPKRATAALLTDFDPPDRPGDEPLPAAGAYSVVLDGRGRPVCVVRTTEVVVKPLGEVDDAFAWDEGEGDRTRDDWLAAHRRYFARQLAGTGREVTDDLPTVFERFALVWAPRRPAAEREPGTIDPG
jgi:uncharacterized protein YhfF